MKVEQLNKMAGAFIRHVWGNREFAKNPTGNLL